MDLLRAFVTSSAGNRWIVVATTTLPVMVKQKALLKGTSTEIARFFLHNIVLRYGAPAVVIMVGGTTFTAAFTEAGMKLCYTDH